MYVESFSKREEMDRIMSTCRKKKTRRGKKNLKKKLPSLYVENLYEQDLERCVNVVDIAKSKNKHGLRPVTSPKAPMNSNQFLIEDGGSLEIFGLSPVQTYESRASSPSLYTEDVYYEPLWVTDTTDFMGKEFEKDYNAALEMEASKTSKLNMFINLSKEELVQKYLDLDRRYTERTLHVSKSVKSSPLKVVEDLRKENRRLTEENKRLTSLILSENLYKWLLSTFYVHFLTIL